MKGNEIYPLVYRIVKRAQKENLLIRNFVDYFQWSLRIPKPQNIPIELADALCTSVSSSAGIGLEIYFQEKVYLRDLENTFLDDQLKHLLTESGSDKQNFRYLGVIIREVFDGRLVPNEKDKELLKSL